jgi:hypothetical protein
MHWWEFNTHLFCKKITLESWDFFCLFFDITLYWRNWNCLEFSTQKRIIIAVEFGEKNDIFRHLRICLIIWCRFGQFSSHQKISRIWVFQKPPSYSMSTSVVQDLKLVSDWAPLDPTSSKKWWSYWLFWWRYSLSTKILIGWLSDASGWSFQKVNVNISFNPNIF